MVGQSVEEFTLCRVCGEIADQSAFGGVGSKLFQMVLIILHDPTPVLSQSLPPSVGPCAPTFAYTGI
jgi:hypothetical protein